MRLIDADLVCNSLLDFIYKQYSKKGYELEYAATMDVLDRLKSYPIIDAVPWNVVEKAFDGLWAGACPSGDYNGCPAHIEACIDHWKEWMIREG